MDIPTQGKQEEGKGKARAEAENEQEQTERDVKPFSVAVKPHLPDINESPEREDAEPETTSKPEYDFDSQKPDMRLPGL